MQLDRDFRERQGEGWERPDAMDQRFNPIDTCPECHEPTERELAVIDGEKLCDACIDDRRATWLHTDLKKGVTVVQPCHFCHFCADFTLRPTLSDLSDLPIFTLRPTLWKLWKFISIILPTAR